jgi:S1-C subfamily serine protease
MRGLLRVVMFGGAAVVAATAVARAEDDAAIRGAVVKIFTSSRRPDLLRPWTKQPPGDATATGVVIEGNRILTNAHVVLYANQVQIQPYQTSEKTNARVLAVAPGIDLALITVDEPGFFEAHKPVELAKALPNAQDTVAVYGYPTGGSEQAITKGIVSRIEFAPYQLRVAGLRIQVDAAINPGNSGGPALVDGKVIGLAFSRLNRADNIGYIIPSEEISLFLDDVADGQYDGKPTLLGAYSTLENDALRASLKLDRETTGVIVSDVGIPTDTALEVGDIITKIGETAIDNTGQVRIEGNRLIPFQYLVQKLAHDGKVPLTVRRKGELKEVAEPADPARDVFLVPPLKGGNPSYFVYGPLVFTDATLDLLTAQLSQGSATVPFSALLPALMLQGHPFVVRNQDRPAFAGERLVMVCTPMFPHPIGKGYDSPFPKAVASVDGQKVKNLAHMVEILRDGTDEFVRFEFAGSQPSEAIVFRRAEAKAATEQILDDNGIRQAMSPDLVPVWDKRPTP